MRVLLTGASSFTGARFARALAEAGHSVTITLRGDRDGYEDVRRQRVEEACQVADAVLTCAFGDERFLRAARGPWGVLCHHAAQVGDYRNPAFDVPAALAANTLNLREALAALADGGCRQVVLTGSVFEPGEGAGDDELRAFSPYGVSKALTAECFRFYCREAGLGLGRFVIPNPFGPREEPRFTTYLAREWLAGRTPEVRTPDYVRDNIHVDLLARAYVDFVERLAATPGDRRLNPSGYRESQGAFTQRLADALSPRLALPCDIALAEQRDFSEPAVRVNTDELDAARLGFDEDAAWDELAAWYTAALA